MEEHKYLLFVANDGRFYITGAEPPHDVRAILERMTPHPPETASTYGDLLCTAGGSYAILRKSGQFSLTDTLPSEEDLDKALVTREDDMHIWSGPPTRDAPDGADAAMVAAAMRHFLSGGGTKATLHALVDVLEG